MHSLHCTLASPDNIQQLKSMGKAREKTNDHRCRRNWGDDIYKGGEDDTPIRLRRGCTPPYGIHFLLRNCRACETAHILKFFRQTVIF